jgi:hypothetical protein
MNKRDYLEDAKKQQNYLELYNATIMKNLFENVLPGLEKIEPGVLERQNSTGYGSPRGPPQKPLPGGSRKLRNAIKKNRTQRKKYLTKKNI